MNTLNAGVRLVGGLLGVVALGAILAIVAVPSGPPRDIFAVPGERDPGTPASKQPTSGERSSARPSSDPARAGHGRIIERLEQQAVERAKLGRSDSANPGGK